MRYTCCGVEESEVAEAHTRSRRRQRRERQRHHSAHTTASQTSTRTSSLTSNASVETHPETLIEHSERFYIPARVARLLIRPAASLPPNIPERPSAARHTRARRSSRHDRPVTLQSHAFAPQTRHIRAHAFRRSSHPRRQRQHRRQQQLQQQLQLHLGRVLRASAMSDPYGYSPHSRDGDEEDEDGNNNNNSSSNNDHRTRTHDNGNAFRLGYILPLSPLPRLVSQEVSLSRSPGTDRTASDQIHTIAMESEVATLLRIAQELHIETDMVQTTWNNLLRYSLLNAVFEALRRVTTNREYAVAPLAAEDLAWLQLRRLNRSLVAALEEHDCGRCTICQEDFATKLRRYTQGMEEQAVPSRDHDGERQSDDEAEVAEEDDDEEENTEEEDEDEDEDENEESDERHQYSTMSNDGSHRTRNTITTTTTTTNNNNNNEEEDERSARRSRQRKTLRRSPLTVCRLPCNHVFCYACLMPWLKRTASCPNCRAELKELARMYESGEGPSPSWWLTASPAASPVASVQLSSTNEMTPLVRGGGRRQRRSSPSARLNSASPSLTPNSANTTRMTSRSSNTSRLTSLSHPREPAGTPRRRRTSGQASPSVWPSGGEERPASPTRLTARPTAVSANVALHDLQPSPSSMLMPYITITLNNSHSHSNAEENTNINTTTREMSAAEPGQGLTRGDSWLTLAYVVGHNASPPSSTLSSTSASSSSTSSSSSYSSSSSSSSLSGSDGEEEVVDHSHHTHDEAAGRRAGNYIIARAQPDLASQSIPLMSSSSLQPQAAALQRISSLISNAPHITPYTVAATTHRGQPMTDAAAMHETMHSVRIPSRRSTSRSNAEATNEQSAAPPTPTTTTTAPITTTQPRRLSSARGTHRRPNSRPGSAAGNSEQQQPSPQPPQQQQQLLHNVLPVVRPSSRDHAHTNTTSAVPHVAGNEPIPYLSAPRHTSTPNTSARLATHTTPTTSTTTTTTAAAAAPPKDNNANTYSMPPSHTPVILPAVASSPRDAPSRTAAAMRRLPCTRRSFSRNAETHRESSASSHHSHSHHHNHIHRIEEDEADGEHRQNKGRSHDESGDSRAAATERRRGTPSRSPAIGSTRRSLVTTAAQAAALPRRPPSIASTTARVLRSPQRRPRSPAAPAPPSHRPAHLFTRRGHFSVTSHSPTPPTTSITTTLNTITTDVAAANDASSAAEVSEAHGTQRERRGHVLLRPVLLQQPPPLPPPPQREEEEGQAASHPTPPQPSHEAAS